MKVTGVLNGLKTQTVKVRFLILSLIILTIFMKKLSKLIAIIFCLVFAIALALLNGGLSIDFAAIVAAICGACLCFTD